jgi:ATP-binding cassette subfamily B protein
LLAIGEGLIFDLRTQVLDHVLRTPPAIFSRTQTGKAVSRLDTDVIGAQQAFTSTMITVLSSLIALVTVLATTRLLSWPLTPAALVPLPIFLIPARITFRQFSSDHRPAALRPSSPQLRSKRDSSTWQPTSTGGCRLSTRARNRSSW